MSAAATSRLSDLNERVQLAEAMVEDRRVLIEALDSEGHDTHILRDMLSELESTLAELKAHRDRLANPAR